VGVLIVLESVDMGGKSSQLTALAQRFRRAGRKVTLTAYPDRDAPLTGGLLRGLLAGEISLVAGLDAPAQAQREAARLAQMHLTQAIFSLNRREVAARLERLLAGHDVVISDRYRHSGRAYAEAIGISAAQIEALHNGLEGDLRQPDLVLVLDVDPRLAAARRSDAERDAFDSDLELQLGVRAAYQRIAAADPRVRLVDGSGTPEEVTRRLWQAIAEALPELSAAV
jgi:dTMP kinase